MTPMMMVSMAVTGLKLLTEAHVQRAKDEKAQSEDGVEDVVHGVLGRLSATMMHHRHSLPS